MKPAINYHEMSIAQSINYRKSGLLLAGIVAAFYTVLFVRGTHEPYVALVAAGLTVLAMIEAWPLRKTIKLLITVGNFMHRFTNPLMFGMIYIVAVIPTAFVLKLFGKDVLRLRYDSETTSYWQDRNNGRIWEEFFRKQF